MHTLLRLAAAALLLAAPALAQPGPAPRSSEGRPVEGRRLPPDSTTEHRLELPGRTLAFRATAGSLALTEPAGAVQAEIGFVAYALAGTEPAGRPVTFVVNGGPGAASAYLHLLAVGPWRLPLEGGTISPSLPPSLVPNAETWLDLTDLVFIDPVDTGYSRANATPDEKRDRYFNVDGDAASIAAAIARWLRQNDRLASPKFFMGESYGGFRGPLVAEKLAGDVGVGLSGLVLVSPVLDFAWLSQPSHGVLEHVARLPSYAAASLARRGAVTRGGLAEVERYAATEYLADLMRGLRDEAAVERASRRVAELSGLDEALVRRRGGRVDLGTFTREFRRADGKTVSIYDSGVSTFDPDPTAAGSRGEDAQLGAMRAPLISATVDHYARRLDWRVPNQRYELINGAVNGAWRYGRGRSVPESLGELKAALALDPALRVMVAHGLTDLVTPYFGSELLLRQLPPFGDAGRVSLTTYPGGHMFYTRADARAAFHRDGAELIRQALEARARD